MNAKRCSVLSCNKTRADNTIMHIFPNPEKEPDRFHKWINAIGGNVLVLDPHSVFKNGRVCHTHFEMKYYTSSRRLSRNSIPSLHLSSKQSHSRQPIQDVTNFTWEDVGQKAESPVQLAASSPPHRPTLSTSTQPIPPTSKGESKRMCISCDHDKIILKKKIKRLQAQKDSAVLKLKKALKLTENSTFKKALRKFSSVATTFTKLQFREAGKHGRGYRFTEEEKTLSLALYEQEPRAYRWLKKYFVLPSPLTLSRMISRADDDNLFEQPQKKLAKMTESESTT